MRRFRLAILGLGFVFLTGGWLLGQGQDKDKKAGDDKDAPPVTVIRGRLPQHYKQLGLSDEQKEKTLRVMGKYRGRISALEQQVKSLRAEENPSHNLTIRPAASI